MNNEKINSNGKVNGVAHKTVIDDDFPLGDDDKHANSELERVLSPSSTTSSVSLNMAETLLHGSPPSHTPSQVKTGQLQYPFSHSHSPNHPLHNAHPSSQMHSTNSATDHNSIAQNDNVLGEPLKFSNNGEKQTNPILNSEEEEIAFLRSLGWDENSEEDEALTEEEIQEFYEKYAGFHQ